MVLQAFAETNSGKALGPDLFDTSVLTPALKRKFAAEIALMMNECKIPDYLKVADSLLISKKAGNICALEDTRCIQLLPHANKVIEKTLDAVLKNCKALNTGKYQWGFKDGVSCGSAQGRLIQALCEDTSKSQKKRKCYVFYDIKKAFDSVDRVLLFKIIDDKLVAECKRLEEINDTQGTYDILRVMAAMSVVKELYRNHRIKTGDEEFATTNGVI